MSTFNIIQLGLILILFAYLIYYAWSVFFSKNYQPLMWKIEVKSGNISQKLKKVEKSYKDKDRFFNFWFQIERLKESKVLGSFAELGVYKGDSAAIIHEMDPSRSFYLFDTFEGFQQKDLDNETGKASTYTVHNFADTSTERVKQRLSSDKFSFHKGYFPDSAKDLKDEQFALVNMDVDLYNPTKAGLEFFYPRLAEGGVIIVHDYNPDWPGIMKAVDEFAKTIPSPIVPLTDTDSSVMMFKTYEQSTVDSVTLK